MGGVECFFILWFKIFILLIISVGNYVVMYMMDMSRNMMVYFCFFCLCFGLNVCLSVLFRVLCVRDFWFLWFWLLFCCFDFDFFVLDGWGLGEKLVLDFVMFDFWNWICFLMILWIWKFMKFIIIYVLKNIEVIMIK